MTYKELKTIYQEKMNEVLTNNQVFWAFNESQLKEGIEKYNISKDNKMVSIGMGGYMPSKNVNNYKEDLKALDSWRKEQLKLIKQEKQALEDAILYELNNYECFYTGELDEVYAVFPEVSRTEIVAVYKKHNN